MKKYYEFINFNKSFSEIILIPSSLALVFFVEVEVISLLIK